MKVALPDDLPEALSDGVILCNLVNQLRPNTISVIYNPPHRARGGTDGGKVSVCKTGSYSSLSLFSMHSFSFFALNDFEFLTAPSEVMSLFFVH